MKADATRQWRLLDLAEIDTRLAQLAHRRARSPEQQQVEDLVRERARAHDDLVLASTAAADLEREVARADEQVAQVRDRMARNQARMDSGHASPKDLQALGHEIDSLRRRQAVLEDEQLEVMERAESLAAERDAAQEREDEVASRLAQAEQARDALFAEVDAERAEVEQRRADVAAGVGADLLALYVRVGEQVGGVGAAGLVARRCTGCNLEVGPLELSKIRAAAADDVVRCEECRRILVRTAESGL